MLVILFHSVSNGKKNSTCEFLIYLGFFSLLHLYEKRQITEQECLQWLLCFMQISSSV